jgi:endonuclease VIII-like 1
MPEISEVRIMSDFINQNSKNKFNKAFHVEKGNNPTQFLDKEFIIKSDSRGKELLLFIDDLPIHIFMGMSGNWKYILTENWNETKFTRLRLDDDTGHSLLLYGGFMGPKYSVNKPFTGTKRGPDPVREFEKFKTNILENSNKTIFNKSLCEVLLNQEYFNGIGAYLTSEIIGRSELNPFLKFSELEEDDIIKLINLTKKCCEESYEFGGGELKDWQNPFQKSKIDDWLKFYGNKINCHKQQFGSRNIWISNKFKILKPSK